MEEPVQNPSLHDWWSPANLLVPQSPLRFVKEQHRSSVNLKDAVPGLVADSQHRKAHGLSGIETIFQISFYHQIQTWTGTGLSFEVWVKTFKYTLTWPAGRIEEEKDARCIDLTGGSVLALQVFALDFGQMVTDGWPGIEECAGGR
jgi:hypothetical protein